MKATVKLFILILLCLPISGYANDIDALSFKDVIEADERSQEVIDRTKSDLKTTIIPGLTPLSTLLGIQEAIKNKDWKSASHFLDMRYLPKDMSNANPEELIRQLTIIWSQNRVLDLSMISDDPQGHLDDNSPKYRDLLGTINVKNKIIPIYLQQIPNGKNKIWKISNATVSNIPLLWEEYGYNPAVLELENHLPEFYFLHMRNWQVFGFLILLICAWIFSYSLSWIMLRILSYSKTYYDHLRQFFATSLRWFVFFKILQLGIPELGLSLKARVYINESALGYIAFTFLILALIEFSTAMMLSNARNSQYLSGIIRPIRTILKILAVIIILLTWLSEAGYKIDTILAGLGIGSLALALAAQKTLENVIGAITLYIAQPVRPGDFCRFGDVSGVIEEIGLRSTRIRRLDRTVVHVPNSAIVGVNLENITETDRRQYKKQLRVSLDSSPSQLRLLLHKIRELILSHPRLIDDAARARFEDIERDAYLITINGYVNTSALDEYLAVAEDLNFRILSIMTQVGINPAIPQQRTVIQPGEKPNPELIAQANAIIDDLESSGELAFPDYSEAEKHSLRGGLGYPERGRKW